ncbi:Sushi, nidogen and EGF-like domain-containing protein 1, partial [Clarias magur]
MSVYSCVSVPCQYTPVCQCHDSILLCVSAMTVYSCVSVPCQYTPVCQCHVSILLCVSA